MLNALCRARRSAVITGALLVALLESAAAQGRERPWQVSSRLRGALEYDDNPFLLDTAHIRKLGQPTAADSASGRFTDMENVRDLVPIPSLEVELSGPGLLGRAVALGADARYEANLRNLRRRNAALAFWLEQALSRADRVRLDFDLQPSYYFKNYLATVSETDGDRLITSDERRYRAGVYREASLRLEYGHRFAKPKKHAPFGLSAGLIGGYVDRTYEAPFHGRDRKGPQAGGSVAIDMGRRWTLGLDYTYTLLDADTSRDVEILDETLYGRDFNANGTTTDPNALALELVDQSRRDHEFGASLEGDLTDAVSIKVKVGRRNRDFTSAQPFDAAHLGRRDHRNTLSARVNVRLAPALNLTLGGEIAKQTTNRIGDRASTGEEAAYTRHGASVGLRYRL